MLASPKETPPLPRGFTGLVETLQETKLKVIILIAYAVVLCVRLFRCACGRGEQSGLAALKLGDWRGALA
jgi:hypothetical protein